MPGVRAVCFDLGGVLIRIHPNWEGAAMTAGVESAATGTLGGFPEFDRYQNGEVEDAAYFSSLADYLGVGVGEAETVHMSILRDSFPGVSDLVGSLRDHGIATGCLSNTNHSHWVEFHNEERFPFWPMLNVKVGSHIVRASKPEEVVFRTFEREVGASGGEVLYFDDSPKNVDAAVHLGWHGVLVDPATDPARQIARALASESL